jgi:hypothetical protein
VKVSAQRGYFKVYCASRDFRVLLDLQSKKDQADYNASVCSQRQPAIS